jgi:N-acyl-D-aspartate/D-glutamate deacylase
MAIYDGVDLEGRVVATLVRGREVFRDGAVTGEAGYGRFVRPGR